MTTDARKAENAKKRAELFAKLREHLATEFAANGDTPHVAPTDPEAPIASAAGPSDLNPGLQAVPETWDGERLCCYTCALGDLAELLPRVERRPFVGTGAEAVSGAPLPLLGLPRAENPYYDLIVRRPHDPSEFEIPVGIVSKRYHLVQHSELLDAVVEGLQAKSLPWEELLTEVRITDLGSRLHFTVHLPDTYRAVIGEDMLDLTIECLNSVDRSWAFRVVMGWMWKWDVRWQCHCFDAQAACRVTAGRRCPLADREGVRGSSDRFG
jgi:hypothetical protein